MNRIFFILWLCFLPGCTCQKEQPVAAPISSQTSQPTGSISGKISFAGSLAEPNVIKMSSDPACVKASGGTVVKRPEVRRAADSGVADVVVYLKAGVSGGNWPLPSEPVTLDQRGCLYSPVVLALRVGQPLKVINSDPTLHNVNAVSSAGQGFNFAMPGQGQVSERKFSKPETMIRVKCDVHGWMNAHIAVFDHPFFAVTPESGTFRLSNVPAGEYVIEAWHAKLGVKSQSIAVGVGDAKTLNIAF